MNNLIKKIIVTIILIVVDLAILVIAVYISAKLGYLMKDLIVIIKEKSLFNEFRAFLFILLTILIFPPYMNFNVWLIKKLIKLFEIHDWQ